MTYISASIKIVFLLLWSFLWMPPQMIAVIFFRKGRGAYIIPQLWHRVMCRIFGVHVHVSGAPVQGQQVMYVANHISYLDILALGSILQASFIAKKEVASWPLFGWLARLQQTAFIDRSGARIEKDHNDLGNMLRAGKSLILFPEGTSTDGCALLPFKSGILTLVIERLGETHVQPVTIRLPDNTSAAGRGLYAWYGDMELIPHLWALACSKGLDIELVFHDQIMVDETSERKALSNQCFDIIGAAL